MRKALREALASADEEDFAPLVLDPDRLVDADYLARQVGLLGATRVRALADIFSSTASGLVDTMAEALRNEDRALVRRTAHQLGSAASAFGFGRLFARAGWVEAHAEGVELATLTAAVTEVSTLWRDSLTELDTHLRAPDVPLRPVTRAG